jgi:hypothetical protein
VVEAAEGEELIFRPEQVHLELEVDQVELYLSSVLSSTTPVELSLRTVALVVTLLELSMHRLEAVEVVQVDGYSSQHPT